jgi:hypothetical protein
MGFYLPSESGEKLTLGKYKDKSKDSKHEFRIIRIKFRIILASDLIKDVTITNFSIDPITRIFSIRSINHRSVTL